MCKNVKSVKFISFLSKSSFHKNRKGEVLNSRQAKPFPHHQSILKIHEEVERSVYERLKGSSSSNPTAAEKIQIEILKITSYIQVPFLETIKKKNTCKFAVVHTKLHYV